MRVQEPDLLKQIFATMNMPESLAELEIKSAIRLERGIAMPDAATSSPSRPPGARRAGADTGSLQALQCLSRASDLFGQVLLGSSAPLPSPLALPVEWPEGMGS